MMLVIVCFCGFARLHAEYQFRKKLEDDPTLMNEKKVVVEKISDEFKMLSKK